MTCSVGFRGCANVDDMFSVLQQEVDFPALQDLSAVAAMATRSWITSTSTVIGWLAKACEGCIAMHLTAPAF